MNASDSGCPSRVTLPRTEANSLLEPQPGKATVAATASSTHCIRSPRREVPSLPLRIVHSTREIRDDQCLKRTTDIVSLRQGAIKEKLHSVITSHRMPCSPPHQLASRTFAASALEEGVAAPDQAE